MIAIAACAPHSPSLPEVSPAPAVVDLPALRAAAWTVYTEDERAPRESELELGAITHDGHTMRFTIEAVGERPADGWPIYIALHGGGGAPTEVNDAQWVQMQTYYRDSVDAGLYVTPRGVSDTWNLHFVAPSYPLYDRLIEDLILVWGANPDRVYLLGFSAGGDGVYQIVPRMADRFAAASMSAGHHNGTDPTNLYRVPFLLQVGEADTAYDRHLETARFGVKLDDLRATHPDGYIHETWIHLDGLHNRPWKGNDPERALYPVIVDPRAWLDAGDRETVAVDSNAIAWLDGHRRDPWPDRVIWDLTTRAVSRSAHDHQRYWLQVSPDEDARGTRLKAQLDRDTQTIAIDYDGDWLRVLLREEMVDLERPMTIAIEGQTLTVSLQIDPDLLAETLSGDGSGRGDPRFVFPAEIVLQRGEAGWSLSE